MSPELEIPRFIEARAPGRRPAVVGAIEYRRRGAEPSTLAVLQAFVPNEGTAWTHAREELSRYFERTLTRHRQDPPPDRTPRAMLDLAHGRAPARGREAIGAYLDLAALLGRRIAEMHVALASQATIPASRPSRTARSTDARNTSRCATWSGGRCVCCAAASARLRRAPPRWPERLVDGHEQLLKIFEPFLHPA